MRGKDASELENMAAKETKSIVVPLPGRPEGKKPAAPAETPPTREVRKSQAGRKLQLRRQSEERKSRQAHSAKVRDKVLLHSHKDNGHRSPRPDRGAKKRRELQRYEKEHK